MESFNLFIASINSHLWGMPMLIMLGGAGICMSIYLKFLPVRKLTLSVSLLFKGKQQSDTKGSISPFAALMTALSATVGTGNIAGVATAIYLGGPGAVFYMWMIALAGMSLKYAEAVCAIEYRQVNALGQYVGGPMYYLKNGVGKKFPKIGSSLAMLFAIFGCLSAIAAGNGLQVHSMADVLHSEFAVPTWITGSIVAVLIGLVIIGGVKRIARVASNVIPAMIILYIGCALAVIWVNIEQVPHAFSLIFTHAFTPVAAAGGFAGAAVAAAIRFGVARGLFSNEAGMGSAAIAHAAATNSPVKQGHIAVLGTVIDTLIICTLTALCILTSGAFTSGENGAPLTSLAFASSITGGNYVVAVSLAVFAFTTLLGWSYYGERCWEYIFGTKHISIYRIIWVVAIYWFAGQKIDLVWNLADTCIIFMAVPNIIGLLILSPTIVKTSNAYWQKHKIHKNNKQKIIQANTVTLGD
jgi:alanine or glycine:cation symporter, AGCS family